MVFVLSVRLRYHFFLLSGLRRTALPSAAARAQVGTADEQGLACENHELARLVSLDKPEILALEEVDPTPGWECDLGKSAGD